VRWRPDSPSIYLPDSGQIDLNAIGVEAGRPDQEQTGLNSGDVRNLIGKASGEQNAMNEYYGIGNSDGFGIVTIKQDVRDDTLGGGSWQGCSHPDWGITKKMIKRWGWIIVFEADPSSYKGAHFWRTNEIDGKHDYGFAVEFPKNDSNGMPGSAEGLQEGKDYEFVVTYNSLKEIINVASIDNSWDYGYEKVVVSDITKTDIISKWVGKGSPTNPVTIVIRER
jgi:hypothetical protein